MVNYMTTLELNNQLLAEKIFETEANLKSVVSLMNADRVDLEKLEVQVKTLGLNVRELEVRLDEAQVFGDKALELTTQLTHTSDQAFKAAELVLQNNDTMFTTYFFVITGVVGFFALVIQILFGTINARAKRSALRNLAIDSELQARLASELLESTSFRSTVELMIKTHKADKMHNVKPENANDEF
jgi:hypothetical protein